MPNGVVQPSVSVIIPTHNRRTLLGEAVDSCLRQTHRNLEIIIVDDGSTDGTNEEVGRKLAATWANAGVRYERQGNAGASSARNHGLHLAQGEYIQFLDSDDLLMPTKIARQIAVLQDPRNKDAPCCHCYGTMRWGADGDRSGQVVGMHETDSSALIRRLCSRAVHVLSTPAPLWRRDHLKQYSGWREDIGLGDDLEYYVRLLAGTRMVCFVNDELFVVREHGGDRLSVAVSSSSSVSSLLIARRSVHESVKRAGLWDDATQEAFLGAMRTIYANALETGNNELIADLEHWLWGLASAPKRRVSFQAMICTRRVFGARVLLRAHGLAKRLRTI